MQRFLCAAQPATTAAPSSSGSGAQIATTHRSAEQLANPSHFKMLCIRDVQGWLAEEPIASCSSVHMQRIREAVAVLSRPKPGKEDVRPLLPKWEVARRKKKKRESLTTAKWSLMETKADWQRGRVVGWAEGFTRRPQPISLY